MEAAEYWSDPARQYENLTYRGHYHRRVAEREEEFVMSQLLPQQDHVLEIGPGSGRFTRHLSVISKRLSVCDVNEDQLAGLPGRVENPSSLELIHADVADLESHPSFGVFDAVVAMRVLPYLDDWRHGLELVWRAVKPGGLALFDLWNCQSFEAWVVDRLHGPEPVEPYRPPMQEINLAVDRLGGSVVGKLRWGYPRIGSLSLDGVGGLFWPNRAYSTTFSLRK